LAHANTVGLAEENISFSEHSYGKSGKKERAAFATGGTILL
jgi:hypothetical protein